MASGRRRPTFDKNAEVGVQKIVYEVVEWIRLA